MYFIKIKKDASSVENYSPLRTSFTLFPLNIDLNDSLTIL